MQKTFIICEVGINANGDVDIAKKLIDMASEYKADAIKFQKRTIDKVYTKEELDKPRGSPWGTTTREQKLGLEFGKKEYDIIVDYCKKKDIEFFASVWDLDSVDFIEQYNPKHYKIPSPRLGHRPLLEKIAKLNKYTFISTGMSTIEEVRSAVNVFRYYDCPFELMHCNSQYPMPDEDANLLCIPMLRNLFNCKVGYSGHSPGIIDSIAAVCLGATSIEKHITISRVMYGSDQPSSLEPYGLKKTVEYIRTIEVMMGNPKKLIEEGEEKIRSKLWREKDCE